MTNKMIVAVTPLPTIPAPPEWDGVTRDMLQALTPAEFAAWWIAYTAIEDAVITQQLADAVYTVSTSAPIVLYDAAGNPQPQEAA